MFADLLAFVKFKAIIMVLYLDLIHIETSLPTSATSTTFKATFATF